MVTLDELMDSDPVGRTRRNAAEAAGKAGRQALQLLAAALFGIGWLLAKTVLLVLLALGGMLYGVGWFGRRAVWPALVWMGSAVRVGWEDGRKRAERR